MNDYIPTYTSANLRTFISGLPEDGRTRPGHGFHRLHDGVRWAGGAGYVLAMLLSVAFGHTYTFYFMTALLVVAVTATYLPVALIGLWLHRTLRVKTTLAIVRACPGFPQLDSTPTQEGIFFALRGALARADLLSAEDLSVITRELCVSTPRGVLNAALLAYMQGRTRKSERILLTLVEQNGNLMRRSLHTYALDLLCAIAAARGDWNLVLRRVDERDQRRRPSNKTRALYELASRVVHDISNLPEWVLRLHIYASGAAGVLNALAHEIAQWRELKQPAEPESQVANTWPADLGGIVARQRRLTDTCTNAETTRAECAAAIHALTKSYAAGSTDALMRRAAELGLRHPERTVNALAEQIEVTLSETILRHDVDVTTLGEPEIVRPIAKRVRQSLRGDLDAACQDLHFSELDETSESDAAQLAMAVIVAGDRCAHVGGRGLQREAALRYASQIIDFAVWAHNERGYLRVSQRLFVWVAAYCAQAGLDQLEELATKNAKLTFLHAALAAPQR